MKAEKVLYPPPFDKNKEEKTAQQCPNPKYSYGS
jgi:hypothetical protein